jgi:alanine-glyoxylate transaminase/serine-glyoxylate transaminase/serine-pyruvate transaminase
LSEDAAANGMTAVYTPEGMSPSDIVPRMLKRGVVVAAGLHAEIKTRYFRIGHMGLTATDKSRGDIDTIIKALKESLEEAGYKFP